MVSNTRWNEEQLRAIEQSGKNMLIAAAAGSGKTAVLVERIIRKITAPEVAVDVDRLFVVTFTEAAAAEMRHRLRLALDQALTNQPDSIHIRRQLSLLGRAQISTLHSFCNRVVQTHGYTLGLSPGFRLAKETEMKMLMDEVLSEQLREKYERREQLPAFSALLDSYTATRDDRQLVGIIVNLYLFSRSHPEPQAWLEAQKTVYLANEELLAATMEAWSKPLLRQADILLQRAKLAWAQTYRLLETDTFPDGYVSALDQDGVLLGSLLEARQAGWQELQSKLANLEFRRFSKKKGEEVDEAASERLKNAREKMKTLLNGLKKGMFGRTREAYAADIQQLSPLMIELIDIVLDFSERMRAAKLARSVIDFSDLEHFTLEILSNPEIAATYQQQYLEVYIDEYQDTNKVQEAIVQAVATQDEQSGNMFMVGDVKQSIYRFRLAEPRLFLEKYERYGADEDGNGLLIDLNRNYRSQVRVLDAVNQLFRLLMTADATEIAYDERAELKHGGFAPTDEDERYRDASAQVQLVLIDCEKETPAQSLDEWLEGEREEETEAAFNGAADEEEDEGAQVEAGVLEGRWIAAKIRELVGLDGHPGLQVIDKKTNEPRPIQYRDILILSRTLQSGIPELADELAKAGIPVYADFKKGYFHAVEVDVIISALQVLDNPLQDIPLAGVLRSPLFGLDENELARIRLCSDASYFYQALELAPERVEEDAFRLRLLAIVEKLRVWRERAQRQSLPDTVAMLVEETRYFQFVAAMPGGLQRQANLRALVQRAREFEGTSYRGLFSFLRYIEQMRSKGDDMEAVRIVGEQEDVVRIMTVHSSKGLEYPVVFLARLRKVFNMRDTTGPMLLHKEFGLAPKRTNREQGVSYPTMAHMAVKATIVEETKAEELRLLYVAMTRARDHLFLVSTVPDYAKTVEKWRSLVYDSGNAITTTHILAANSYLDWMLLCKDNIDVPLEVLKKSQLMSSVQVEGVTTESEAELALDELPTVVEADSDFRARWDWRYPWEAASLMAAKQSVSDLKHRWSATMDKDAETRQPLPQEQLYFARPQFMQEKTLTPAERGSGYHTVMQHLRLDQRPDLESVEETIADLHRRELLSTLQMEAISAERILAFFDSLPGRELLAANDKVWRELPFTYALPVFTESGADNEPDQVLVQGVIDVLYENEEGLVILDYKTDSLHKRSLHELVQHYRIQIDTYAIAIQDILKRPVTRKYLYFSESGDCVDVDQFFRYHESG